MTDIPATPHRDTAAAAETIAVIGLGYVGLPVAVALAGTRHKVIGFDVSSCRVTDLRRHHDATGEVSRAVLERADLRLTSDSSDLADATAYLLCVPTPVTDARTPDLGPLRRAAELVARTLAPGNLVVVESTVFPGATEQVVGSILEAASGLKATVDFDLGYSPERINPGDARHALADVVKVIAANSQPVRSRLRSIYAPIVPAGLHEAASIRIGEAAKVIENTQRDLNIALVNELAVIFRHMAIDTEAVLDAAASKWNFHRYRPGLVGGHCIGVDPYYLTHKAQELGYQPEVILAGRRINDSMGEHVAQQAIKALLNGKPAVSWPPDILILGFAFKENCGDVRNTGVARLVEQLAEFGARIDVHDPRVDPVDARHDHGIDLIAKPRKGSYDLVILAVAHPEFVAMGADRIRGYCRQNGLLYDLEYAFDKTSSDLRL